MKKKNRHEIVSLLYVAVVCIMVLLAMTVLSTTAIENDSDTKESYEVEITSDPKIEHYVTLSVDVPDEREEPEIQQDMIGTFFIDGEEQQTLNERYMNIKVTQEDIDLMAAIVYLEAGNQCFAGQRMVAEVILNRVVQGDMGGDTIHDVVFEEMQFTTVKNIPKAEPNDMSYEAVYVALTETPITDEDVVYFAKSPYNDSLFCKIGAHYFCYKY